MTPNILLVVLDSVRAKNTSLHGYSSDTTPYLREFATSATTYSQARAPSTWSLPSHVSLFTGEPAHRHGVTHRGERLLPGHTVFDDLAADGYTTGVFSENPFLVRTNHGLQDCFDHVSSPTPLPYPDALDPERFVFEHGQGEHLAYLQACLADDRPLRSLLNGAALKLRYAPSWLPLTPDFALVPGPTVGQSFLSWVDDQHEPWAACVNLMDAHTPYEPTELVDGDDRLAALRADIDSYVWDFYAGDNPWWLLEAMEALYNDTIRDADRGVKTIVEGLRERGLLEDTLVVVTSDHGEGFGEPAETTDGYRVAGHGRWASEEVLHVPLVVKYPEQSDSEREDALCSIAQFPRVAKAAVAGERASFADTDGDVLASSQWRDFDHLPAKFADRLPLDVLTEPTRVAYREVDGVVYKHIARGDRESVFTVPDAMTKVAVPVSEGAGPALEDLFTGAGDATLATSVDDDVDEEVLDRLRDLGYA